MEGRRGPKREGNCLSPTAWEATSFGGLGAEESRERNTSPVSWPFLFASSSATTHLTLHHEQCFIQSFCLKLKGLF